MLNNLRNSATALVDSFGLLHALDVKTSAKGLLPVAAEFQSYQTKRVDRHLSL